MPRARTGTLLPPGADGLWRARVTTKRADGTTCRPVYSLGSTDKSLARRRLARLIAELAAGRVPHDAVGITNGAECVSAYAEGWLGKRLTRGIATAPLKRGCLKNHVFDAIGTMPMGDVTPSHIRNILDDVAAKGRKRGTVEQVRGVLHTACSTTRGERRSSKRTPSRE